MNQIRKEILSLTQDDIGRKFDKLKRCLLEDRELNVEENLRPQEAIILLNERIEYLIRKIEKE